MKSARLEKVKKMPGIGFLTKWGFGHGKSYKSWEFKDLKAGTCLCLRQALGLLWLQHRKAEQCGSVWVREDTHSFLQSSESLASWETPPPPLKGWDNMCGPLIPVAFQQVYGHFPFYWKHTHCLPSLLKVCCVYWSLPVKKVKKDRPELCKHSCSSLQCIHQSRKATPGQSGSLC